MGIIITNFTTTAVELGRCVQPAEDVRVEHLLPGGSDRGARDVLSGGRGLGGHRLPHHVCLRHRPPARAGDVQSCGPPD